MLSSDNVEVWLELDEEIELSLDVDGAIDVDLSIEGVYFGSGSMPYEGPYEAIPAWIEQGFETMGKTMRDDFTVHSILELEVANEAGGLTLTI